MTRLSQIPIRVESLTASEGPTAARGGTIGGGIAAILMEIAAALDRLASSGECTAIDLRSLPMNDAERAQLSETLGRGEVHISLEADGSSSIRETDVHGVWWIEYRDRHGELLAALIEVARVPTILVVETDELQQGAEQLRRWVAAARAQ